MAKVSDEISRLPGRARHKLEAMGSSITVDKILSLTEEGLRSSRNVGTRTIAELMAFQARCRAGEVVDDEAGSATLETFDPAGAETVSPEMFDTFPDYVRHIAHRQCPRMVHLDAILSRRFGVLNDERTWTLDELAQDLGGISRARVQQIGAKALVRVFSAQGKALFGAFVREAREIFHAHRDVLKRGKFVAALGARFPAWKGTTEFSAVQLLRCCGIAIEENESDCLGWMTGTDLEERYRKLRALLDDETVPLEMLAPETAVRNAERLGMPGLNEDEFRFLAQRAYDQRPSGRVRWELFLRLRCGLHAGRAARRRYAAVLALRAAGPRGLTVEELLAVCRVIDPNVRECILDADTSPDYDMDGLGTRLIHYDFRSGGEGAKRYTLDIFFRDPELVRAIKAYGERLRRHMEANHVGVVTLTRFCPELRATLPEAFRADLPVACLYSLMREYEAGGLKYYDHPNVAHPKILNEAGDPPRRGLSWVTYEHFKSRGVTSATSGELVSFCESVLGMDTVTAASNILPPILGERQVVDGKIFHALKPPVADIDPPVVLV